MRVSSNELFSTLNACRLHATVNCVHSWAGSARQKGWPAWVPGIVAMRRSKLTIFKLRLTRNKFRGGGGDLYTHTKLEDLFEMWNLTGYISCLLILCAWCYAYKRFYKRSVCCPFSFLLLASFSDHVSNSGPVSSFCFQRNLKINAPRGLAFFFLRTGRRRTGRRSYELLLKKARLIWSIDDSCKKAPFF